MWMIRALRGFGLIVANVLGTASARCLIGCVKSVPLA
jgi:hypothetical protein